VVSLDQESADDAKNARAVDELRGVKAIKEVKLVTVGRGGV